ncbi:MAG: hypothetical protein WCF84_04735 [Anaerolineae bacterium]
MTSSDWESRLNHLLASLGLASWNRGAVDEREVESYLHILRHAPEPSLAAGRQRVLAEAALLPAQNRAVYRNIPFRFLLQLGGTTGAVALLILAAFALVWSSLGSGGTFGGLGTMATLVSTQAPSLETAVINTDAPAATLNPTPAGVGGVSPIVPVLTPEPAIAPSPARSPQITLTRTAPPTSNP